MNYKKYDQIYSYLVVSFIATVIAVVFFLPFLHPFIVIGIAVVFIIWSSVVIVTTRAVMNQDRYARTYGPGRISFSYFVIFTAMLYYWYPGIYLKYRPMVKTLELACSGEVFAENPPFKENEYNSLLIIDSRNTEGKWIMYPGELGWTPKNPSDVTLIGCFDDLDSLIQTCRYTGGSLVERYRNSVSVRIIEAKTGTVLGERVFSGIMPENCAPAVTGSDTIHGEKVSWDDMNSWIRGFVNPDSTESRFSVMMEVRKIFTGLNNP